MQPSPPHTHHGQGWYQLRQSEYQDEVSGPELASVAVMWFFFFQAEDGIRDLTVTGVQTCALPILMFVRFASAYVVNGAETSGHDDIRRRETHEHHLAREKIPEVDADILITVAGLRSEERRVGKECRSRWSPYH